MALSSINFQKSSGHSYKHNFRYDKPNYLLKENDWLGNDYWENGLSAKEIFENELSKAHRRGGRIPKFENSHWEAVLNLNKEHTLDDVKKVADYLENKLNITCATIAVHRDEGYYDKNGKACYNFHAHLTFVTYKNNQQNWRQEKVRNKLREIQTEIAEILKMERGIDKRESKRQRLEHREYKQKERELKAIKQELEAKDNVIQAKNQVIQDKDQELEDEKLSKKRLKEQIEAERKAMIEENQRLKEAFQDLLYIAEDYKKLRELKEKQDITIAELNAEIEKIKKEARERETQKNQEIQALKADKQRFNELLEQNPALKEAYYHALEDLKNRENEEIKYYSQLNFITDDKPLFSINSDKIEVSEQNQENNHDDLGIDKIIIHKNQEQTQEHNKPKIRKNH
ncbi:TPA: hypothetical protein RPV53_000833 [Campylobacter fetus]|nr:hypothetical protein [Campylobacter fetus]